MSFTRRSALALTATGITAALTGIAASASARPSGVHALIEAHRAAVAFADAEWKAYNVLTDANPDVDSIIPKVQYGRILRGRNDDGTDQFEPLYAYFEKDIDKAVDHVMRAELSMWGSGPHGEKRRPEIREKAEARRERLKAELRRQNDEKKAAEDACGMTAGLDAARAASDIVEARLDALLAYSCRDVSEVVTLAAYLVQSEENGIEGIEPDTAFVAWVRSLAGQAVQS